MKRNMSSSQNWYEFMQTYKPEIEDVKFSILDAAAESLKKSFNN